MTNIIKDKGPGSLFHQSCPPLSGGLSMFNTVGWGTRRVLSSVRPEAGQGQAPFFFNPQNSPEPQAKLTDALRPDSLL